MKDYGAILVDVCNVYYRIFASLGKKVKVNSKNLTSLEELATKAYIKFIDSATAYGDIVCLLFDPFATKPLFELPDEGAQITSLRQQKQKDYKANRKVAKNSDFNIQEAEDDTSLFNECKEVVFENIYKHYTQATFEGKVDVYYSSWLEADDFAKPLCDIYKDKKIAMVTSDLDWARYLGQYNTVMIREGLKITAVKSYTKEQFIKEHGFYPSYESVVLWKALFGDVSDNITGAFLDKRSSVYRSTANRMLAAIDAIGKLTSKPDNTVKLYDLKLAVTTAFDDSPIPEIQEFKLTLRQCESEMTDTAYLEFARILLDNIEVIKSYLDNSKEIGQYKCRMSFNYTEAKDLTNKVKALQVKSKGFSFNVV